MFLFRRSMSVEVAMCRWMMVKATGDLRQEVKKVAVITPRFSAESTPAEKASSGLFSMLEVESDLKGHRHRADQFWAYHKIH